LLALREIAINNRPMVVVVKINCALVLDLKYKNENMLSSVFGIVDKNKLVS
jgi:hypothetical protein